uniref:Putative response regulator receiver modulated metal dependent phosphohydrolase n=1 Tax=Magnetococcus massalia (strain MO-1) TaxID=451514 RepID=A0A1S7LL53_MAGMO|nr:Putative response regulator receiver modulated metal dependent phosphohydrolase [Candidatus Magnetococcus massalia]
MSDALNSLFQRPKVLLVDDSREGLQILIDALGSEFAVVVAREGQRALEMAAMDPPPDVILLDVMMPGMDGYSVCRHLKESATTRDIPVIFLTSMTSEEDEFKGLNLGAVDYISKPFSPPLVRMRVKNHVELKRHRDMLDKLVEVRTRQLTETQQQSIQSLANLAETRDPETGGHIRRVESYMRMLAEQLWEHRDYRFQFGAFTPDLMAMASPLHDVGKVGVADEILLKAGQLDEAEWAAMRKHCLYGWRSLRSGLKRYEDNPTLWVGAEIALTHHERWDGAGYPEGLSGLQIPLPGRLMALADVYDALISKRVYKPPFRHGEAVSIIREEAGRQFDPVVVEAFLALESQFREVAMRLADFDEEREMLLAG